MRKYSNFFRVEVSDDNDSQGSATPCSPTVESYNENVNGPGGNGHAFGRQLSKLNSFNFVPSDQRYEHLPFPPEELRCPISLQLMHDPVIISSGQTYERSCIEQWFSDGHNTCPKTQHRLSNFDLTPNYCVKGLISSWCGQNGVPTPDAPPECLDLNYWRLALSEGESNSKSVDATGSCKFKRGVNTPSLEDGSFIESEIIESMSTQEEGVEVNLFERYTGFLTILHSEVDVQKKCEVVEEVRHLLKGDEDARKVMGANGFVEALMQFLVTAVDTNNRQDQEVGAMALFNLAVENNRNTEMMLAAGMISILEEMIADSNSHHRSATALFLTLSFLDEAKPIIASSKAVPFLILLLGTENDQRCRHDSLRTVYNLSTSPSGIQHLLSAGIINSLSSLLTLANGRAWIERSIAVLLNIAATAEGKEEITSNPDLITGLAGILDADAPDEQEYAVTCLLTLCTVNDKCSQMVLQEGVIPSLVLISVNGKTTRGKEKAKKLLMLFREQRQSDSPTLVTIDHQQQQHSNESCDVAVVPVLSEKKVVSSKVVSKRKKIGKILSFLWKSKASQHTRADACRA